MFGKDDSKKAVATRLAFAVVFALALLGCAGCAQVTGGAYDSPSTPESAQTDAQKSTESAQDAESVSDDEGKKNLLLLSCRQKRSRLLPEIMSLTLS